MAIDVTTVSSGYVREEERTPHVPVLIETSEVIQRRLAVNKESLRTSPPRGDGGWRGSPDGDQNCSGQDVANRIDTDTEWQVDRAGWRVWLQEQPLQIIVSTRASKSRLYGVFSPDIIPLPIVTRHEPFILTDKMKNNCPLF